MDHLSNPMSYRLANVLSQHLACIDASWQRESEQPTKTSSVASWLDVGTDFSVLGHKNTPVLQVLQSRKIIKTFVAHNQTFGVFLHCRIMWARIYTSQISEFAGQFCEGPRSKTIPLVRRVAPYKSCRITTHIR